MQHRSSSKRTLPPWIDGAITLMHKPAFTSAFTLVVLLCLAIFALPKEKPFDPWARTPRYSQASH